MAYIGRIPQVGNYFTLDSITTSATATFNLLKGGVAYVPESAYHIFVSLNGVIQAPITAYTVSGSTIIFASPLASTDVINFITVLGDTLAIGTPSDATVGAAQIAATLDLSSKTVTLPAASVTAHVTSYDDNKLQSNIALLGFKTAVNGSLAKYNLQDQIIDEYSDATGVDTGASTNEILDSGTYHGITTGAPTTNADNTTVDGADTILKWTGLTSSGNVNFGGSGTLNVEYLVVAGGGSGSYGNAGGGGAGGYLANGSKALSLTKGTSYTITVGDGGNGGTANTGQNGGNSSLVGSDITDVISIGGGWGSASAGAANAGGSGGGGWYNGGSGGAATSGQGNAGGGQTTSSPEHGAGGGGGAGAVGSNGTNSNGGDGGVGLANDITGASVFYAGGGGGASNVNTSNAGNGGNGGGGHGGSKTSPTTTGYSDGVENTGGGGGGAYFSGTGQSRAGNGGSGIVVIRFTTIANTAVDMTLQSTDTTALTQASNADMVMLMENATGTATLNTDIKGYISRDSGSTFTQGTLVDEGTWGTNKKILAFHDLDISSQPAGTSMCYKIETLNQAGGSKETKIHATSIGWK